MVTATTVTPTGFKVLAAMLRHRDHGVDGVTKYFLADCVQADKSTVHILLRGFIDAGWVAADRSVDPETCVPHPTIYSLTSSAPSLDELLGITE